MRKILITSFLFFLIFAYGLVLSQVKVSVFEDELEPANHAGFYDYRGITNVHTDRGMGSGSVNEVIRSAQAAQLDYLFITDLNVFSGPPVPEGYHRQLLVMTGTEYSYLESRLLTYDRMRRHSVDSLGQAQVLLADLLSQSGPDAEPDLIILAHPSKPGFSWTGAYPSGIDGIEVLNLKSIWQQAWNSSKISFLWSAIIYPFNPQLALLRLYNEPEEELSLWDQLSLKNNTIGMAGAEATAKTGGMDRFSIRFPSYQTSFSLLSNHVLLRSELTGHAESDRSKILRALESGQFYMCLDLLGNPKGFSAYIQDGEKIIPMGSRAKWAPGMKLVVHIPRKPEVPFETAFLKDGQHIMSSNSEDTEYELHSKGVYRVIVRVFPTLTLLDGQRWLTWIYSNPFYLD
jgi:hypothetical protein